MYGTSHRNETTNQQFQETTMSKKSNLTPIAAIVGAALVGSLSAMNVAAGENPFTASQLDSGYMQLASSHGGEEGKCGEGKCGGEKEGEGKCGGEKEGEGKCGEGKCGGEKEGEGKCGGQG
jgi:uncharacterized low-complexity protein